MKFKTSIIEIKKAISFISPIVNHGHASLAFRYVLIKKFGDKIEIKAYNDSSIGSGYFSFYDFEGEDCSAYVLAKHLFGLVNSFDKQEILFTIEKETCFLKCGRSEYKLKLLEESVAKNTLDDYDLSYEAPKESKIIDIKTDLFTNAYNLVSHCLSKDSSRRDLQNVYLVDDRMIACDGVKGASVDFYCKNSGVMLHKIVCDCLLNLSGSISGEIKHTQDRVYGYFNNFNFVSIVDDNYPYDSFKGVIDGFHVKDHVMCIKLDPDEIIDKLSRILMFSDNETNSVLIEFEEKKLLLLVENNTYGKEEVNVFENLKNNSLKMYVDGSSLKDVLSKSKSETLWYSDGKDGVQYIYDGGLLQFFMGLED